MSYEEWKAQLASELCKLFTYTEAEAIEFVESCDDDPGAWRTMFDDGLTPEQAVLEEADACAWMDA